MATTPIYAGSVAFSSCLLFKAGEHTRPRVRKSAPTPIFPKAEGICWRGAQQDIPLGSGQARGRVRSPTLNPTNPAFALLCGSVGWCHHARVSQFPRISIVTPSFNQGCYLGDLIESVRAQQDPNFEHIIMDGGSTDETVEVLRRHPHLVWKSEKDGGQSDAVCKALALATGEIVGWINSDDFYYPGAFEAARRAFAEDPTLDVVTGDYRFVDAAGHILRERREVGFDYGVYLYAGKSYLSNCAIFFRRQILNRLGGPRRDLHHAMDFELLLRLGRDARFHHLRRFLACYRLHDRSKTATDLSRGERESLAARLEVLSKRLGGAPLTSLPWDARVLSRAFMARRVARKFFSGCYRFG